MEFPHELKDLFPNQIIEVRGNADALTLILNNEVDVEKFKTTLKQKFFNLEEKITLFLRHEGKQDFEKFILQ